MTDGAKKVRRALMARYRQGTPIIPVALREQPVRTQYKGLQRQRDEPQFMPTPELMGVQPDQAQAQMALDSVMAQADALAPADPFGAAMGGDMMPGGDPMGPMMAPEGLPPGGAGAQARTPAQEGPGVDPQQVLASLFG